MAPITNQTVEHELQELHRQAKGFETGEISSARFRAFRVPFGVYEQREDGRYMVRVRLPAGLLEPRQMRALADVARRFGDPALHLTTRQGIQVHRVRLGGIHPALVALRAVGLTTRGAGGNTVRNLTVCAGAGVCKDEVFDVTSHAAALGQTLCADALSYRLPRKYKIALSGCSRDCAAARVHDLGLIAQPAKAEGREVGFSVHVGGGLGAHARVAELLSEHIPAREAPAIAEAVKRVFDQHGNRKNKHIARLRFLLERLGMTRFAKLVQAEFEPLQQEIAPSEVFRVPVAAAESDTTHQQGEASRTRSSSVQPRGASQAASPSEARWRQRVVSPQKQAGHSTVEIHLPLGDISSGTLEQLADVVEAFGDGRARATQWQNLQLRGVPNHALSALFGALDDCGLAAAAPAIVRRAVACAGAATCRLGICLSRPLLTELTAALSRMEIDLERLGELDLHISGCANSCGRHALAQIGLHGVVRRVGERLVPHYVVQLAPGATEQQLELASGGFAVPARHIPALLADVLEAFARAESTDFAAFLRDGGNQTFALLAARYQAVPPFEENAEVYRDWGAAEPFSLAGRGPGECSAGVFDLIELDLQSAKDALSAAQLDPAVIYAARALLVTRGLEAASDLQALELFETHFIAPGQIDEAHRLVVGQTSARLVNGGREPQNAGTNSGAAARVATLVEAVEALYRSMDESLRLAPPKGAAPAAASVVAPQAKPSAALEVDFRGVSCPLNYVKTKLALAKLRPGDLLTVRLDLQGAKNVPLSAEKDGHEVVSNTETDDHFTVVLRRGP